MAMFSNAQPSGNYNAKSSKNTLKNTAMKKKPYKWLERLVDKITKDTQPNNDYYEYYNHNIT